MKQLFALLFAISCTTSVCAQESVTLTVSNPSDSQRQEVVEADLQTLRQRLGIDGTEAFVIKNGAGQEVAYQQTYDGKLLIYAAVQPHKQAVYTITKGQPAPFKSYVGGNVYPERVDDLAWENDRGIYRIYGPALQRTGERSFGTDVWSKNGPELMAEARYRTHLDGVRQRDSLKRAGHPEEGEGIYLATSFHYDHGQGLDLYGVGASLGCGAPALMRDGQLVFPYCYQDYKILDNGPLRFTAELTYGTTTEGTREHRIISLDRGSHFNRMTVWYDGISSPVALATGVVLHDNHQPVLGPDYVQYADPTDNPRVNQTQLYVATLFPNGVSRTTRLDGSPSHAVGIVDHYTGAPYTYYFGSAWSGYDVRTEAQWHLAIEEQLNNFAHPLQISIHKL